MTDLHSAPAFAQLLQQFFLERLIQQRNASPRTVAAYRDTMRLLLQFAEHRLHRPPERLAALRFECPAGARFPQWTASSRVAG